MNRRRILSGIHTTIARKQGTNAAAWFAGQSFNSGTRGDMPLTRLTDQQVNAAGAGLLPACSECGATDCPHATNDDATCRVDTAQSRRCTYCGGPNTALDELYCSNVCAINAERP